MLTRHINDYHFLADKDSGTTFRWGKTFEENPSFAPVPELADISISNRCTKGCFFCYRDSTPAGDLMSVEDYCQVLDSMNHPAYGNVFQVALGGGEPLEHPDFLDIIDETIKRDIIPNFTTNGLLLDENVINDLHGKIGALAISVTNINSLTKFSALLAGNKTIRINIHYILSGESICQAIGILEGRYNGLLEGINAIVFLTYKPAGRGENRLVLRDDENMEEFLSKIAKPQTICKIGFDACFVPILLKKECVARDYVDFCEGGFFSVYINEHKEVSPCSFSRGKDAYSLNDYDFYDIWLNKLQLYRDRVKNECQADCVLKPTCKGACTYYPQITTCYK